MKRKLTYLLILLLPFASLTQDSASDERAYEQEQLDKFNSMSSYDYDRIIPPSNNLLAKFFRAIARAIVWLFSNVLGYLIIILLIGLLIWIIVKNTSTGKASLTIRKNRDDGLIVMDRERLMEEDFDKLLQGALKSNNFRLAIRYTFLKSLKILQLADLIDWHKEKTNYDYLRELPTHHHSDFKQIVSVYEYVWYGEFSAEKNLYDRMHLTVDQIMKSIRK
ncbi:MAG: DUF4129 domain-containing protein [Cytophagales bacterium]|nr:DUF4129 domain-containing protein [Cytophagales bacterium]